MKVILLQEIKGQGGEGDVVEVKRGYAVNYLFPQNQAILASKGNLKQLELRKHNIAKREVERLDSAEKIQTALADKEFIIQARVGEEGQLFGSVTTQQIADKLNEELGLEIDRRKIDLHAAIKTAGEHSVTVAIYRDIKAVLKVNIVSDGEEIEENLPIPDETVVAEDAETEETAADEAVDGDVDSVVEDTVVADGSVDAIAEEETANAVVEAGAVEAETEAVEAETPADDAANDEQ